MVSEELIPEEEVEHECRMWAMNWAEELRRTLSDDKVCDALRWLAQAMSDYAKKIEAG